MRDANGVYFLLSDHLGSSSVVVDESGQVVEEGYYLPWGGERGNQEIELTDYGYTGQMQEGGIYFYNARYYDPAIGRFMQAGTIVPMATQGTQAFDRYAYVNNNPLRYTDPSGNKACDDYYGYNCGVYNASTINYKQLVKNLYGVVFNPKTPFNEEQTKIVYDSLKLMSDSVLNNYGLTGSRWVKETFEGTMVSLGGWATKLFPGNSVTLSDEIQLASDLSSQHTSVIIHEFGHVLDNRSSKNGYGTYFEQSLSSDLAEQAGLIQFIPFKFSHFYPHMNGAFITHKENKFDTRYKYGNSCVAEYFAVGFEAMIVDPGSMAIPTIVPNFSINLFRGMR